MNWRKPLRSHANGNCVQVANGHAETILVQDTADPSGPVLAFTWQAWARFAGDLTGRRG